MEYCKPFATNLLASIHAANCSCASIKVIASDISLTPLSIFKIIYVITNLFYKINSKNNKVSIGDLFLFFGWFKNFNFIKKDIHLIFGWLEIDEVISGNLEISKFLKQEKLTHPHDPKFKPYKNNTLYVARKNFGLFKKFSNQLTLTAEGYSRSMWEFPKEYFKNSKDIGSELFANRIQWNDKNSFLVDTNLGPGQEFILNVEKNPQVKKWAKSLIKNNI